MACCRWFITKTGCCIARIAEILGEKPATVHNWKKRDKWGDYGPLDQMQLITAERYWQLITHAVQFMQGCYRRAANLLPRSKHNPLRIS